MKKKNKIISALPVESVINKILVIRNQKVILDRDLAGLYGVETRALKQAVRRNIKRFPEDFLLILTRKEIDHMVSQNVIPSKSYFGGANPMAFTEQGVAMLSSVLNSERAIEINILIMRAFVKLREIISTHKKVKEKLKELESKLKEHDNHIVRIIQVINQLIIPSESPKRKLALPLNDETKDLVLFIVNYNDIGKYSEYGTKRVVLFHRDGFRKYSMECLTEIRPYRYKFNSITLT